MSGVRIMIAQIISGRRFLNRLKNSNINEIQHNSLPIMYKCIMSADDKDDSVFEEEVYKYFESKYADDLMKDVRRENIGAIADWINRIDSDSDKEDQNIRENLSHLRTSAMKVTAERPQAFSPYFLYAYAILSDPDLDIRAGLKALLDGVKILKKIGRRNYRPAIRTMCEKIVARQDDRWQDEARLIIEKEFKGEEGIEEMLEALS